MAASASERPIVLVVEDDEDARETIRLILEDAGCKVIEAGTGHDGRQATIANDPDVVIADHQMDGTEDEHGVKVGGTILVGEAIVELGLRCSLIGLTANVARIDQDRLGAMLARMNVRGEAPRAEVMSKPFDLDDLVARVRRLAALAMAGSAR